MADVEISVGLGRKVRMHPAIGLVGLDIFGNSLRKKILRTRVGGCIFASFRLSSQRLHNFDLTAYERGKSSTLRGLRQDFSYECACTEAVCCACALRSRIRCNN